MNTDRLLHAFLTILTIGWISMAISSCKDDNEKTADAPDITIADDRDSDEAIVFKNAISQLCDVEELPNNWKTATYEPTIGEMTDAAKALVRTVYVANREEAMQKFMSLIPDDVEEYDIDGYVWQDPNFGSLTFNYDFEGTEGCLATVEVKSPRIPKLEQIRYVNAENMGTNSNYFTGNAYYQLGDVVKDNDTGRYWICVRPAHPKLKGDSHWVSLSYSEDNIKSYQSDRYPQAYVPTGLKFSDEHLSNFCRLIFSMLIPNELAVQMGDSRLEKGLGGLDGIYDDNYVKVLCDDWDKEDIWKYMPPTLRDKFRGVAANKSIDFYVSGYTAKSTYLKVYTASVSYGDFFTKVKESTEEFRDKDIDLRGVWKDGTHLVFDYKRADKLDKKYKGDKAFDETRFTTVYRFLDHHQDMKISVDEGINFSRYTYRTISATGDSITLSGLMGWPKNGMAKNVIIGCHITITQDAQAPYNHTGYWKTETGMLVAHSKDKSATGYNCLVVIPDYEGYGLTKDRIHPYLCQEITAHQVVDGARAGLKQFKKDGGHLNPNFKSVTVGFSQGGSVALSSHRLIEETPEWEEELHFAGSVCGDGPYDPMATFQEYFNNNRIFMPVVMPLVLSSYCEYDPDMKAADCKVEDFLEQKYLNTGVLTAIKEKKKRTNDIQDELKSYVKDHASDFTFGKDKWWYISTTDVVKNSCVNYFKSPSTYTGTDKPKYEALKKALERNAVWGPWTMLGKSGWHPHKPTTLFHSFYDETVPYQNYISAKNHLSTSYYGQTYSTLVTQGHVWTGVWWYVFYELGPIQKILDGTINTPYEDFVGGLML